MMALWPIDFVWWPIAAPILALGLVIYGRRRVVGLSIERAARRAHLIRQVRFALAQQDIRSLILLRRQLGFERPRGRPLLTLSSGRLEDRVPALYRDARSYLRWPTQRIVRISGLSVVAGICLAGLWEGTTALAAAAAAAVAGGAVSTKRIGPSELGVMMPDEVAGLSAVLKVVWPIAFAGVGVAPVILARSALDAGHDALSSAITATIGVATVAIAMFAWIRSRDSIIETMAAAKDEANQR